MSELTLARMITWLPVGGIERRLVAVLPKLRDYGWTPKLICIREEGPLARELKDQGIEVVVVPFRSRVSPPGIMEVARHLKRWQADVMHCHMYRSNIPGTIAAWLAGVPVRFAQIHNVDSWDNNRQRMMEGAVKSFRTGTFAVSKAVQRDVMRTLREPESRVPVLYNGIDVEKFTSDALLAAKVRQSWGVADDVVVFMVPARLHPQKNPEAIIHACAELKARHPDKPFQMLFFGDGKLKDELQQLIESESLTDCVRLMGKSDAMREVYCGTDAMVLSSSKEGFSNAVIESLACGTPVIASDVGGNAEAIDLPDVGWIHPAGAPEALLAQLSEALERGRTGLEKMQSACRERAETFSLDEMIRQTDRLYRQALKATKP